MSCGRTASFCLKFAARLRKPSRLAYTTTKFEQESTLALVRTTLVETSEQIAIYLVKNNHHERIPRFYAQSKLNYQPFKRQNQSSFQHILKAAGGYSANSYNYSSLL